MDHPWTEYATSSHHDGHHKRIAELEAEAQADHEYMARQDDEIARLRNILRNLIYDYERDGDGLLGASILDEARAAIDRYKAKEQG